MSDRELDAMVATLVMGWTQTRAEMFVSPPTGRVYVINKFWEDDTELQKEIDTIGELLHTSSLFTLWQPSIDIAAAMPLIENETDFEIEKAGDNYHVFLPRTMSEGSGKTLPSAICRAAVMAAEAE